MAHKSFKRAVNLDPIVFDIPGPDGNEITFHCENEIPGGVVFAFIEEQDEGKEAGALTAVWDLFDAAIVDDEIELFHSMAKSKVKKQGIPVAILMELATWLTEQYSARPTGPTSVDGQSASPSGSGSTGGALHAVTTYSKPEPVALTT